ncbi:hypothetical protein D3C71_1200460 [compost metagenome]
MPPFPCQRPQGQRAQGPRCAIHPGGQSVQVDMGCEQHQTPACQKHQDGPPQQHQRLGLPIQVGASRGGARPGQRQAWDGGVLLKSPDQAQVRECRSQLGTIDGPGPRVRQGRWAASGLQARAWRVTGAKPERGSQDALAAMPQLQHDLYPGQLGDLPARHA